MTDNGTDDATDDVTDATDATDATDDVTRRDEGHEEYA